jgi:hypothetical protein
MESVQFNFIPYWRVRNYETINKQYYQNEKGQRHHYFEQSRSCKGCYHQNRQQENADHFIDEEYYKNIHIRCLAHIEYPTR